MPCDSVRVTEVNLGKVNLERFARVLRAQGFTVKMDLGTLTASAVGGTQRLKLWQGVLQAQNVSDAALASIRRDYSATTVADTARRFGWSTQTLKTGQVVLRRT